MAELIKVEVKDQIATVRIDNPPMNVLSSQVTKELYEVFNELEQNNEVVVVILTGAGERAFMAGADIKEFPNRFNNDDFKEEVTAHEMLNYLEDFPKPTIALLNGFTLGGGLELALTSDVRIAEDHAQIGLPEIKLGIFPGGGGTQRLPRLIGTSKAKELMFSGDPLTAEVAHEWGIVNRVVAKGNGLEEAEKLANKFASYSLQALSRIKQAVNKGIKMELEEGLKLEESLFNDVFHTEDAKEGVKAFIEKRKPVFTHK